MAYEAIVKSKDRLAVAPNLADYEAERAPGFWERVRVDIDGLPRSRGLNIAYEAVDRHAAGERGAHLALRWLGKGGDVRDLTYIDLRHQTNRFANVLAALGLGRGDVVCTLAGRIPELYVTALGALKHRCVVCPLFSQFGPEPVRTRLALSGARALVTTEALYARKVHALRDELRAAPARAARAPSRPLDADGAAASSARR